MDGAEPRARQRAVPEGLGEGGARRFPAQLLPPVALHSHRQAADCLMHRDVPVCALVLNPRCRPQGDKDHNPLRNSHGHGNGDGILGALKKAHLGPQEVALRDQAFKSAKAAQASRDEVARLQARLALLERGGGNGNSHGNSNGHATSSNGLSLATPNGARAAQQQPDSNDIEILRLLRPIIWAHEDEAWLEARTLRHSLSPIACANYRTAQCKESRRQAAAFNRTLCVAHADARCQQGLR